MSTKEVNSNHKTNEITISLSTFILTILIGILIIASMFLCKVFFDKGYINGYEVGYSDAYVEIVEE